MPDFTKRSYDKELLDRDDIPFEDILRNMEELDLINKKLGGHSITRAGLYSILKKFVTSPNKAWLICEIGCGNGNNLAVLHKWCVSKKINANFIGIDINQHCIDAADTKKTGGRAKYIVSDYRKVQFERKPDIVFSSLFSHHFTDEQLVEQLRWMKENSKNGFFINDLHRHQLAYHSIKTLTKIFSKSYLVKNDAPLSVLRGFSRTDWEQLLKQAGIDNYSLKWKWAFRWLIVVVN